MAINRWLEMLKIGSSGVKRSLGHDVVFNYYYHSRSTLNKGGVGNGNGGVSPVFVNYLISLGLSREEADPISAKLMQSWQKKKRANDLKNYHRVDSRSEFRRIWSNRGAKTVSDFNFVANADSVVSFLEHSGFREAHIRELALRAPMILVSKVNPTLKPKVEVFLNLGLSVTDLTNLVSTTESLLSMGFKSTIVPSLDLLRQVMGSDSEVISLVKDSYLMWVYGFRKVSTVFLRNVALLRDYYGTPDTLIREWIARKTCGTLVFHRDTESFKNVVVMLDEKFGIPPNSDMFFDALHMFHTPIGDDTLHSFKQILKSFGWTDSHIAHLLRNHPSCLRHYCQDTVVQTLDFLTTKLGYDPNYIASFWPDLFYCDFKVFNRELVPRYEVFRILKEKGLIRMDQDFRRALRMSEYDFKDKFVIPYEDVHQVYFK